MHTVVYNLLQVCMFVVITFNFSQIAFIINIWLLPLSVALWHIVWVYNLYKSMLIQQSLKIFRDPFWLILISVENDC